MSSVRVCIPKRSVTSKRWASSRAIEMRVASWPKIGSPTERSAWAKALGVAVARDVAGLEVHLGDALVVAAQEADQDLGVDPAGVGVDPAHDAEVERDERAVGPELEVALVHVGVEEAVAERVGEEGLDDPLGEPHEVGAAGAERRQVAEVDAATPIRASARGGPRRARSTAGTRKPGSRSVLAANSAAAAASMRRSSSPCTTPSKCRITAFGRSRRAKGARSSTMPAAK